MSDIGAASIPETEAEKGLGLIKHGVSRSLGTPGKEWAKSR